jgi:hypothetical protein
LDLLYHTGSRGFFFTAHHHSLSFGPLILTSHLVHESASLAILALLLSSAGTALPGGVEWLTSVVGTRLGFGIFTSSDRGRLDVVVFMCWILGFLRCVTLG